MKQILKEIQHNKLLWLLAFVPVVFAAQKLKHDAHTLLFVLSVLAIVPLAALLSHATESVAAKTGDAVGCTCQSPSSTNAARAKSMSSLCSDIGPTSHWPRTHQCRRKPGNRQP